MTKQLLLFFISLSLLGCDTGPNRFDSSSVDEDIEVDDCAVDDRMLELESQLEEARAQVTLLEGHNLHLQDAIENLQSNIERFSDQNWRDVVPDVAESAEVVATERAGLESAISDAGNILAER